MSAAVHRLICGSACAMALPFRHWPPRPRKTRPRGTRRGRITCGAVSSVPAPSCSTSSRKSKSAACPPSWPSCRWWNQPTTRARFRRPRPPACGNSFLRPASASICSRTGGATTAATSLPRPPPRSTTCRRSTPCSATGSSRWQRTTGAKARSRARSRRRVPRVSRPTTPVCACRPRPPAMCPSCRRSRTLSCVPNCLR